MDDGRERRLAAIGLGPEVKRARSGFGDLGSGDEEIPFRLSLDDEQAVQADVVHVKAVRQIAPRILVAQFDAVLEVMANGPDPGRNGLARADAEFQRLTRSLVDVRAIRSRKYLNGDFGGLRQLNAPQGSCQMGYIATLNLRMSCNLHGTRSICVRCHGIGDRVDCRDRFDLPRFNFDG